MPLTEKAYLELEDGDGTGVFELQIDLEYQAQVSKTYIVGNRGQYIREAINEALGLDIALDQSDRRTGFSLDGGAGSWENTLTFSAGIEESSINWGDGSSGRRDAGGASVSPLTRSQVLEWWIANTRSDSFGYSRIHIGEWTDGSYPESNAGKFGMPMPIAITEFDASKPEDDPNAFQGTLSYTHVALVPAGTDQLASWAETAITDTGTPTVAGIPEGIQDVTA